MASDFADSETAGEFAKKIYEFSTNCLMAHSIRAVEQFLKQTYKFDTKIVLAEHAKVRSDTGRMSCCSVAQNNGDKTYILVQKDDNFERSRKRFCVAHELYHVIWSVASAQTSPRTQMTESACDVFANDLCRLHDEFYADSANLAKLRFHGLPYRSV